MVFIDSVHKFRFVSLDSPKDKLLMNPPDFIFIVSVATVSILILMRTGKCACSVIPGLVLLFIAYKYTLSILEVISVSFDPQVTFYWVTCLIISSFILPVVPRKKISIIRKFFHAVVICMFGPLIWIRTALDFITVSGVLVLAFMICLECFRVTYPKSRISVLLTRSFQPVLDKKDSSSSIITSHMELLIASIAPVWLRSISEFPLFQDQVVLMSGLVTVGVGDSLAAIVGITLSRVHPIAKTGKSFEGSLAFLTSVCLCFILIEGGSMSFATLTASIAATLTECFARNHDNITIPSVFLFVYYLAKLVV